MHTLKLEGVSKDFAGAHGGGTFRVLKDTGVGVVVADHGGGREGASETHARYRLDGVGEVEEFLRMLIEAGG